LNGLPEAADFRIVLNYRRDDTGGHAGRLYDALSERFGDDHVFMDIDTIEPGTDFAEVIDRAVGSCDAFLALVGTRWLTATDAGGRRRLDSPEDYVRLEIEAALKRKVRVIPVLLQGAEMPTSDDLPESLSRLARIQAQEVSDGRWHYDIGRLIATLENFEREKQAAEQATEAPAPPTEPTLDRDRTRPRPPESPPSPRGFGIRRRALLAGAGVAGVAVVVVVLALLLGGGSELGKLVYGQNGRIFTVLADGSGPMDDLTEGSAPDWSRDGKKIAFVRSSDIWVMNADGTGQAQLTRGPAVDNAPAWSPDGERLLFDRTEEGSGTTVVKMNADGSDQEDLTGGAAPDWSRAGNRIVFQRRLEIWVMNADGGPETPITRGMPGSERSAAWSPDGTKIAFAWYSPDESEYDIYLMNPDGTDRLDLTKGTINRGNYPTWSPDGNRIAIAAPDGIWIVNRDGSGLPDRPVVSGTGFDSPAWAAAAS
jgi:hypothetical protein